MMFSGAPEVSVCTIEYFVPGPSRTLSFLGVTIPAGPGVAVGGGGSVAVGGGSGVALGGSGVGLGGTTVGEGGTAVGLGGTIVVGLAGTGVAAATTTGVVVAAASPQAVSNPLNSRSPRSVTVIRIVSLPLFNRSSHHAGPIRDG